MALFPALLGRNAQQQRDLQSLRDWVEDLPVEHLQHCCASVFARLPSLAGSSLPSDQRFDLLERLTEQLVPVLASLETESFSDTASPSCGQMAERLLIRLCEAYLALLYSLRPGLRSAAPDRNTRIAALRCGQYAYRRALLASRLHHVLDSGYWTLTTQLYLVAREARMHDTILDEQTSDSVTRFLTRILLLALADPQTLTAEEIEEARFYIERYGQLTRITPPSEWTGDDEGWFLVWPTEGALCPMLGSQQVQPEVLDRLLLDTHPLLARLDIQREELAAGHSPTRLGLPRNARNEDYQFLLDKLRQKWSRHAQRQTRRYPLRPHATIFIGFDAVRKAVNLSMHAGMEGCEIPGEEWEIADHSATGFRIEQVAIEPTRIGIGELIGLAAREGSGLSLTVARRARRRYSHDQELGLELLGGSGLATGFTPPPDEANTSPAPIPLIFLPKVPRLGNAPGLLAPLDEVAPGLELSLPLHGQHLRFEAMEQVERFAHCELIRLNEQSTSMEFSARP
ncbi:hypothetical protein [Niveibacterium terrae]|uniref:hypothetical protein n=1 Tax=Niveibacterium terrae TaxID=3373598 RepID=UPI003A908CD8